MQSLPRWKIYRTAHPPPTPSTGDISLCLLQKCRNWILEWWALGLGRRWGDSWSPSQICSFLIQDYLHHPTRPCSGRCSEVSASSQWFPRRPRGLAPWRNWPSFVFVRRPGFNWFVVSYRTVRSQCRLTSCLWDKRFVFIVCQAGCCYRKRALGMNPKPGCSEATWGSHQHCYSFL